MSNYLIKNILFRRAHHQIPQQVAMKIAHNLNLLQFKPSQDKLCNSYLNN